MVLVAVALLISSSALSAPPASASPTTVARPTPAASPAGETLQTLLADVVTAGVPGVVVRVQGGTRISQGAAGTADLATGAALRPDARFRVGSITKTFVAAVVLQLVGERRLSLDRPVARWLPGILSDGAHITVRQLLNHTSGLYDYAADPSLFADVAANRVF